MPRLIDHNGYLTVNDNPITKVGVFPYLGKEIGAPDPNKIYKVYRPEEELNNEETINSFKLTPFIDDHTMLGNYGVSPEKKGVQGVIGENVYFDYPYLRGNIRVYSDAAKSLIENGKIDLSPGYLCRYEFTEGVFDGEKYDAIQRTLRGNHLALVDEGRTGPDVAVQDHAGKFVITLDSKEVLAMPQTMEELLALIKQAIQEIEAEKAAVADAEAAKNKPAAPAAPAATTQAPPAKDEEEEEAYAARVAKEAETAGSENDPVKAAEAAVRAAEVVAEAVESGKANSSSMDSMSKAIKSVLEKTKALVAKPAAPALDSAQVIAQIEARNELYKRVTPVVGNFDANPLSKSAEGIAQYACEKLGLKPAKGQEVAALDGYLAAAEKVKTVDAKQVKASVKHDSWEV